MSWNFCPWCGHRTYVHNGEGCTHIEAVMKDCSDPECQPDVVLSGPGATHRHLAPLPCDCKHPWTQMVVQAG